MEKIIELRNSSIIRNKKTIINSVSLDISRGEHTAIIGKNGSGKSFLLRIISASLYPSKGEVNIFGRKLGTISIWELKKRIGFVSDALQREYHSSVKVMDVIYSGFFSSIGLYNNITAEMKDAVREILSLLEIEHLKDRTYGELSHGEQKRVIIARALVFNPDVLIFDEPCNGLDIPSREDFLLILNKLSDNGHTIIVVTHHVEEVMPFFRKVVFMKSGRIYMQGKKEELMNKKNLNNVLGYDIDIIFKDGRYWLKH